MLGVIHQAVLLLPPCQLHEFFVWDLRGIRRSARVDRHDLQILEFACRLALVGRSCLGLIRVYNRLPKAIVEFNTVEDFQRACSNLMKSQIAASNPRWQLLFSPRIPLTGHPLGEI